MHKSSTTRPPTSRIFAASRTTQIVSDIALDDLPIQTASLAGDFLSQTSLTFSPRLFLFHLFSTTEDDGRRVRRVLGRLRFEQIGVRLSVMRMRLVGLSQKGPEHLFRELGGRWGRSLGSQDTRDGRVVLREERIESVQTEGRCERR